MAALCRFNRRSGVCRGAGGAEGAVQRCRGGGSGAEVQGGAGEEEQSEPRSCGAQEPRSLGAGAQDMAANNNNLYCSEWGGPPTSLPSKNPSRTLGVLTGHHCFFCVKHVKTKGFLNWSDISLIKGL